MILRTIAILLIIQTIASIVDMAGEAYEFKGFWLHYALFAFLDLQTVRFIKRYHIPSLTRMLEAILLLSAFTHVMGGFCYFFEYETGLLKYDKLKTVYFYAEIMAFITYGMGGGIKKLLRSSFRNNNAGNYRRGYHSSNVDLNQNVAGK